MKKNLKFRYTLSILTYFIFISCENFLQSGDVREKMIAAREFEEAKTCTVLIKADSKQGEFLSAGEKTLKVGYDTELQFTVKKKDYVFKGFEAVNLNNPEQSLAKYVTFNPVSQNEENGIYKYNVKLLDSVSNLLIRPVCVARPKIVQKSPELESSGCAQNTPIQITFNKPVKPQSFGDFSCISIFANENLAEYFETPVFSSDNKTLYIPVNPEKQILAPNGPATTLDIDVTYDFTNAVDADGVAIAEQGSYTYKINNDISEQKKVVVMISSESEAGEFNSSGEKECIVGYSFDLVFTLNKDSYSFVGFEVVSSADNITSRADCVSFNAIDFNNVTGVYSVSVRVLAEQQDILIRPVCKVRPYVQNFSPAGSEPHFANSSIVLTFNTQMEASETVQNQSLFNYENIFILYTDSQNVSHNMSAYFEQPVFDSQKKILTIEPKALALKEFIQSKNAAYIDLKISFSKKIDLQNGDYTVRYVDGVENNAPEKINFFVTAKPMTLQDENRLEDFPKFIEEDFDFINAQYNARPKLIDANTYKAKLLSNRAKDCVYIYGKYLDADSGVKKVIVTQDGVGTREFTAGSPDAEFYTDKNNYTSFCIKFNLLECDNAFTFKVSVLDACNNPAETQNFFAVSRTHYESQARYSTQVGSQGYDMYVGITNQPAEVRNVLKSSGYWTIDFDEYKNNLTHFEIYPENVLLNFYDRLNYTSTDFLIYCKYIDKEGIERNEKFNDYDEQKGCWDLDLNLDTITGKSFTIKIIDEVGAEGEYEFSLDADVLLNVEKEFWRDYTDYSLSNKGTTDSVYYIWKLSSSNNLQFEKSSGSVYFNNTSNRIVLGFIYQLENGLYSDYFPVQIPDGYVEVKKEGENEEERECIEILPDKEAHTLSVKFTFADNTWNKFEQINLKVEANTVVWDTETIYKGSGSLEYVYTFKKTYDASISHDNSIFDVKSDPNSSEPSMRFTFSGVGSSIIKTGLPSYVYLSSYNEGEYEGCFDEVPPSIYKTVDFDNYTLTLKDEENGSGPKGGTFTLGLETYNFTEQNNYKIVIPVQKVFKNFCFAHSSICRTEADYEISDKNNNTETGTYSLTYSTFDENGCDVETYTDEDKIGMIKASQISSYSSYRGKYDNVRTYMYDPDNDDWIRYGEGFQQNNKYDVEMLDNWSVDALEDKFVRVHLIASRTNLLYPRYVYTGTHESSGKSDFLLANGDSKKSVILSSDAPVLVQVFTTTYTPDIHNNWDAGRWCMFGESVQRTIINFSPTEKDPRVFYIDDDVYNDIPEGSYYVVVVVLASNEDIAPMISQVMQK